LTVAQCFMGQAKARQSELNLSFGASQNPALSLQKVDFHTREGYAGG